jgi:phage gpG-like protein
MADVRIDDVALRRLLTHPGGQVLRDMWKKGKRVESKAKRKCPVDHGRLRSSLHTEFVLRGWAPFVRVGTNVRYAAWVHNGTGIYGPSGKPIVPKRAKVLVFTPRGSSTIVFAKFVKGMKARPFLKDALDAVNDE